MLDCKLEPYIELIECLKFKQTNRTGVHIFRRKKTFTHSKQQDLKKKREQYAVA